MLTDAQLLGAAAVGDDAELRLVEHLTETQIDEARYVPQRGKQRVGNVVILRTRAGDLDVDGARARRSSESG